MWHGLLLTAGREVTLLRRNRAAGLSLLLLVAVAWLPPLMVSLRRGVLGLAAFPELTPFSLAVIGVVVPLIALLAGTDLLAGELEDGSLVPVLTLPITRSACLLGKYVGRSLLFSVGYGCAFASSAFTIATVSGVEGLGDYILVAACGLALSLSCLAVGAAIGASRGGRVKAFGASLIVWLVLVFVIDAALLAVLVAGAPAAPGSVGAHGHAELAPLRSIRNPSSSSDPHARYMERRPQTEPGVSLWWVMLNPVDLFRISAITAASGLRDRFRSVSIGLDGLRLWAPLLTGWLLWLAVPLLVALKRVSRLDVV